MKKFIIGIDPSTHCGWAVLTMDGKRYASGTWELKGNSRFDNVGVIPLTLRVRLESLIKELRGVGQVVLLALEDVVHLSKLDGAMAAHAYGSVSYAVAEVCNELEVPCVGYTPSALKKQATGKGNANKDAMVAAANAHWGIKVGDDNEADALWAAETGRVANTP